MVTWLFGVSTAVRSPITEAASSTPKRGRYQSESRFAHNATRHAAARAANSTRMTVLLGRPGMVVPIAAVRRSRYPGFGSSSTAGA